MAEKNRTPQEGREYVGEQGQEMTLEDRLFRNLRGMAHQMQHRADARGGQRRILGALLRRGEMSQKDMQELLGIQAGSLSEVLSKLEAAGLISRTPNEADRRGMQLALTQEGMRIAQEREAQRRESREQLFQNLSQEEKATLADLLEKLNEDWHSRFGKPEGWCGRGHGRHGGGHGPGEGHDRQGEKGGHGKRGGGHGKQGDHENQGHRHAHGGQDGKSAAPHAPHPQEGRS